MWLKIPIDLETEAAKDHLLKELDRWIDLGLLSAGQSLRLGRKLCSPLPVVPSTPSEAVPIESALAVADSPDETRPPSTRPTFARLKSRLVQSFLDEISVLWLLFLGVFLVVVSSGVLAASQWQAFSSVGQYAILLVYTLAFGAASRWAASQDRLQTTAQMLKAATLLLIPLNMWMIDALGLASSLVGIVAGLGLSALMLTLTRQKRAGLNLLGLSWLHWGWGLGFWPLAATYLGTLGSAVNLVWAIPGRSAAETEDKPSTQPGSVLVAIALLLLIARSLWIAQVPIYHLGLAFGICGWMLCRLYGQYPLWPRLGAGLMIVSWLSCFNQQPLQALGISGLATWLLLDRLHQQTQDRRQQSTLAILWLVGLQACWLMWLMWPLDLRQTLLAAVEPFGSTTVSGLNLAGIWLHSYVGLMVWAARQFRIVEKPIWAKLTEKLALSVSVVLVFCALPQIKSVLFTLSLLGLTLSLGAITYLRRSASNGLIYSTHGVFLITLFSGLWIIGTDWTQPQWALVFLGLTTLEWLASTAGERCPPWRRSAWYLGIGLSLIAYILLLSSWEEWRTLVWLLVPGILTWLVYRPNFPTRRPQLATLLTVVALGGQIFLLSSLPTTTAVFGLGAGLLFLHSYRWPTQKVLPALTVGFAVISGHTALIWLWLMANPWPENVAQCLLAIGLWASVLSILGRQLARQTQPLLKSYGAASHGWSRALAIELHLILTLTIILSYNFGSVINTPLVRAIPSDIDVILRYGAAATTLMLARLLGQRRLTNLDYCEFAYGLGLLASLGLSLWRQEVNLPLLGAAMVGLSLATQLIGTVYSTRKQRSYPASWHYIPLAYGALGLTLGHLTFTATTGIYTIAVGSVTLAISRRNNDLHLLSYGGLGLLSLGTYELVIYRMLQASGGAVGDGLTLLGLVGSAIALLYLLGNSWLERYGKLTTTELSNTALVHWVLSVCLGVLAMLSGHSRIGALLWLGLASLLTLYALLKGNYRWFPAYTTSADEPRRLSGEHHSYRQWTWSGLTIATIAVPYGVEQLLPNLTLLRGWGALLACGLSLVIYRQPWQHWGWPFRPWRHMSLSWPMLAVLLSMATVVTQSLLLVGAFYAFMAKQLRVRRLSYLSLGLLDWSLLRYLSDQGWLTALWLGTIMGLSALYILEIDPRWQSARQERHYLRSLATLLIGLTAIFQAETGPFIFIGLSLLISLSFIGLGLVTRVRAYLYVGTLTFAVQIMRTIMMFVGTDGRLLWAVGIMLGISLIWVAATFESRRAQISELLTHWSERLESWD